ncbi:MAG: hypothetical protein HQL23_09100 [Candidatus Omnitrophica bacterium]|nr:hypothetical protein [Candidatus Omnitrophota bacterium]
MQKGTLREIKSDQPGESLYEISPWYASLDTERFAIDLAYILGMSDQVRAYIQTPDLKLTPLVADRGDPKTLEAAIRAMNNKDILRIYFPTTALYPSDGKLILYPHQVKFFKRGLSMSGTVEGAYDIRLRANHNLLIGDMIIQHNSKGTVRVSLVLAGHYYEAEAKRDIRYFRFEDVLRLLQEEANMRWYARMPLM